MERKARHASTLKFLVVILNNDSRSRQLSSMTYIPKLMSNSFSVMTPFMHLFQPPCVAIRCGFPISLFSYVKEMAVLGMSHGSFLSHMGGKGQIIKHTLPGGL